MLDFVLTSREELVGNVVIRDSLGCSDVSPQDSGEIFMAVRRACRKLTALDFRSAHFGLFMDLLGIEPWRAEEHKNAG